MGHPDCEASEKCAYFQATYWRTFWTEPVFFERLTWGTSAYESFADDPTPEDGDMGDDIRLFKGHGLAWNGYGLGRGDPVTESVRALAVTYSSEQVPETC